MSVATMRKLPAVIELLLINALDLRDPPPVPWGILSFAALRMNAPSRDEGIKREAYGPRAVGGPGIGIDKYLDHQRYPQKRQCGETACKINDEQNWKDVLGKCREMSGEQIKRVVR